MTNKSYQNLRFVSDNVYKDVLSQPTKMDHLMMYVYPQKQVINISDDPAFDCSKGFDLNLLVSNRTIKMRDLVIYLQKSLTRDGPCSQRIAMDNLYRIYHSN